MQEAFQIKRKIKEIYWKMETKTQNARKSLLYALCSVTIATKHKTYFNGKKNNLG